MPRRPPPGRPLRRGPRRARGARRTGGRPTRTVLTATATLGALAALGLAGCASQPPAQADPACPIPLPTTRADAEWPLAPSTPPGCPDGRPEPGRYVADLP